MEIPYRTWYLYFKYGDTYLSFFVKKIEFSVRSFYIYHIMFLKG